MSELHETAGIIEAWAARKGILTYAALSSRPEPESPPPSEEVLRSLEGDQPRVGPSLLPQDERIFDVVDHCALVEILKKIRITVIGLRRPNEIVLCHLNAVPRKRMRDLPQRTVNGIKLEFFKSAEPIAQPPSINDPRSAASARMVRGHYPCGSSISLATERETGTLGCLMRNRHGTLLGLTANHVTGRCSTADHAMPVIAPGHADIVPGNLDPFTLGHHYGTTEWKAGTVNNVTVSENLDGAAFTIAKPESVTSMQGDLYDTPAEIVTNPEGGMTVEKVGRSTGHTTGFVYFNVFRNIAVRFKIKGYEDTVHFEDMIAIVGSPVAFADRGDSGALVVTSGESPRRAVGILVAVTPDDTLAYVMPMDRVLSFFGCTLESGHNI